MITCLFAKINSPISRQRRCDISNACRSISPISRHGGVEFEIAARCPGFSSLNVSDAPVKLMRKSV